MGDMLAAGAAWIASQLVASASVRVTYWQKSSNLSASGIPATLGHDLLQVTDGQGSTFVVRTDRDFLIQASLLAIRGSPITPNDGDQITVTTPDGVRQMYEVMPVASDPAWRWSDPYRTILRIHTKYREDL